MLSQGGECQDFETKVKGSFMRRCGNSGSLWFPNKKNAVFVAPLSSE